MMPSVTELARQLAVMVELNPEKTASELARDLGYSPLFVINAISEAEGLGLLRNDKESDKLIPLKPVDYDADGGEDFGDENTRLQDEIVRLLVDRSAKQEDIEENQLRYWLVGVRPSAIDIALHILKKLDFIATYELADPADSKSVYTFLTLKINENEKWGAKQFKQKDEGSDDDKNAEL